MTHDMDSAHSVPLRRPEGRNVTRPKGAGQRPRGLVQKARQKRTRILSGDRHIPSTRWAGATDPTFDAIIRRSEGLADVRYIVTRDRIDYIVRRESVVPPFGKPTETTRRFPRKIVESLTPRYVSTSMNNHALGHTATVMMVTLEEFMATPYWVKTVRVHMAGKPVPRPDDDNAPDYDREGDGYGDTIEAAYLDALDMAGCGRNGDDLE
jgi:hypothetical protein